MKTIQFRLAIILGFVIATAFCGGCANNEDVANPLDPDNLRTAGSPAGLELTAGDAQVKVSWQSLGVEGISKYRIYRKFSGDANPTFTLVGEVVVEEDSDPLPTEFIDTQGIKNDQFDEARGRPHVYTYRISYVDKNGVEIPDPDLPPDADEEPRRIWPTASVTPSIPPPAPNVTVGDPTDLIVKLFWQDYEFPDDFEIFRVFAAEQRSDGNPLRFQMLAELTPEQTFFFDGDFERDGITKRYRVIAVDRFGAEGVTALDLTSPNLPPAPPKNVQAFYRARSLANNQYDVTLSWSANKEPDLDGYQIYWTEPGGTDPIPRSRADRKKTNITIIGESPLLIGQELVLKEYHVAAFDNTPKPDGKQDESEMVAAPLPQ